MARSGGCLGCLGGCIAKAILLLAAAVVFFYVLTVILNPWALRIGGRSTPLLYWQGTGTVLSKDGKAYPLYVSFFPGRPGRHGGRREGKGWGADLYGRGWLCVAPGSLERMKLSGTMYGGYSNTDNSLFEFRLLEWRNSFTFNYQNRGFLTLPACSRGRTWK